MLFPSIELSLSFPYVHLMKKIAVTRLVTARTGNHHVCSSQSKTKPVYTTKQLVLVFSIHHRRQTGELYTIVREMERSIREVGVGDIVTMENFLRSVAQGCMFTDAVSKERTQKSIQRYNVYDTCRSPILFLFLREKFLASHYTRGYLPHVMASPRRCTEQSSTYVTKVPMRVHQ